MGRAQPVLVLAGRAILGVLLAIVFSVLGIGVAWGLYVFSGSRSFAALFSLFLIGAGLGAGLGGFLAWLRIDRNTRSSLVLMGSLALAAGIGGAWGGYEYGARQEVECCATPTVGPMTYTAVGATVVANSALMAFGLIRDAIGHRRRRTRIGYSVT
jgi:hypothetical protein